MAGSYREIDYRLRPAKYAERLMLCDALRRLRFATVESYQYVGLGSVYFSDFALFHRTLGITKMVSIERELNDQQRFFDNRPYANIELSLGETTTELPKIDLSLRTILWLDYDGRLSREILDDVRSVAGRVASGSVLTVTVQCRPEATFDEKSPREYVDELAEKLGRSRVDHSYDDSNLLGWGTATLFRNIVLNEIEATLSQRNGVLPRDQRMAFGQIFNFHYRDGVHMLTFGGVFYDRGQKPLFDQCAFDELQFVRRGPDAFRIEIPKLTARELRLLDTQMPIETFANAQLGSMPARDAEWFVKIYRYFPNFTAVDL